MMITRTNLNEILFENQDAMLLIEYVVLHTQATLYYYHDELTAENALKMYNRAIRAEEEKSMCNRPFLNLDKNTKRVLYS